MEEKEIFKNQLEQIVSQKNKNNIYLSQHQYEKILSEVKAAKLKEKNKNDLDYRRLKRYDVITVGKKERLIRHLKEGDRIKYFATIEETYGIIHDAHLGTGHAGRNRLVKEINNKYNNITTEAVMLYLSLCEACQKKAKGKKKGISIGMESLTGEQALKRCICKGMCSSKKCSCKNAGISCNSKCHNSNSCSNK